MSEVVDRELERAIALANNAVDTWLELLEECEVEYTNRKLREQMIRIVAEACAESFARPFHETGQPGEVNLKLVVQEIERLREELRQSWYGTAVQSQPPYTINTGASPFQVSGSGYSTASSGTLSVGGSHSHTIAPDTNATRSIHLNEYMTKEAVEKLMKEMKFDPPTNA